jgi:SAM-dependent methyltransferase
MIQKHRSLFTLVLLPRLIAACSTLLTALLITFLIAIVVICGWRLLSRKLSLPCPSALIWLLENRMMDRVAGSAIVIQRAKIERGMRVLDAGCGPGRITIPLAAHVGPEGEVVALDVQESMLSRLADRMLERSIKNVRMIQAALGEGALENEQFDRAIMVTVLGEVPDREAALREIHHALKPGGLLSITEILPDPHYQSRRTVRVIAERVGFNIEEVHTGLRSYTMNLVRTAATTRQGVI